MADSITIRTIETPILDRLEIEMDMVGPTMSTEEHLTEEETIWEEIQEHQRGRIYQELMTELIQMAEIMEETQDQPWVAILLIELMLIQKTGAWLATIDQTEMVPTVTKTLEVIQILISTRTRII